MNNIQAEITITLGQKIGKTEKYEAFERFYKFSMPVGAPFEEAVVFAEEMVKQIKVMQEKAAKLEKEKTESTKTTKEDPVKK